MYIRSAKEECSILSRLMIFVTVFVIALVVLTVKVSGGTVAESNCAQAEAFRKSAPSVIRSTLEKHYFSNSGIMLTASFENEYVTGFTVMISNEGFSRLDDISKQVLSSEIEKKMMDTWDLYEMGDVYPSFSVRLN